jgi:hypothetical protein
MVLRYCFSIIPRVSLEAWMASTVDERVFLVPMSRLASNHTGTRAHLQRINVVQDALCQCAMGYDAIDHGLWECGLHCALRNELQEKLRAAGIDHGSSIRDILAISNTQRTWVCTSSQMPTKLLGPIIYRV